ncbi:hypothetical protein AABB24_038297 [Solanum stoloniferum]|uniref:Uncharacterized protein n=1 Tax=Solanum stoloniferum TaxID=62892 RepID=A0ABD2QX89_9SOLN
MNSVIPQTDDQPEEQAEDVSTQNKRCRTQMHNVYARKERKLILLNRENQPVGPTNDVVIELSSFLGTLAGNVTFAHLIYLIRGAWTLNKIYGIIPRRNTLFLKLRTIGLR